MSLETSNMPGSRTLRQHSLKAWTQRIAERLKPRHIIMIVLKFVVTLGTLPYYRTFQFNTLQPIRLIAFYSSQPEHYEKFLYHLDSWRTRKLAESQYISVACAILVAAVIGSFSWSTILDAHWLTFALWYSSLILSVTGIIQSAQQALVLQILGRPPVRVNDRCKDKLNVRRYLLLMMSEISQPGLNLERIEERGGTEEWRLCWKMIFIWQCPIMCLSYSVLFFLSGLMIFVCTPLIRGDSWNTGYNVAVVCLATVTIAGGIFGFGSFWIFHSVDLDHGPGDTNELGNETSRE